MKNLKLHNDFSLNGKQFDTTSELLNYAKTFSSSVFSFLSDWFNDTKVVVVQTSGSTGEPKQLQLQKQYMLNSAIATGTFFDLPEKTTVLLCLSTDYIAGKMMLVRAITLGWQLDIVEASAHPLNRVKKSYDFSAMVPLQLYNSIDGLDCIKKLIVGGGIVSKDLKHKISNVETEIFATYGMTETSTHIAVKKLNDTCHTELDSVSHYKLLPNIKISKDNRGCLVIDAPTISDDIIITNDLVEIISQSEFKWLGRYDSIINSGGVKLIPEEIENILSTVINSRFFVAGIADAILGEKLILIIEQNVTSIDSDFYRSRSIGSIEKLSTQKLLSKFEIPKEIYYIDAFIETETKKINRIETMAKLALS